MTPEERAKTDEAFKDTATEKFWMSQVNYLLDHNPNIFPNVSEAAKQEIRKLPRPGTPEYEKLKAEAKAEKAAIEGDAEAQFRFGDTYYSHGHGDLLEAAKWFRKAAEQGHIKAQNCLGDCYAFGRGVPQDYDEALKWFQRAAEKGDKIAELNVKYVKNMKAVPAEKAREETNQASISSGQRSPKIPISFSETERAIFRFVKRIFFVGAKIVQIIIITIIILIILYLAHLFLPGTDYGFWRP